METNPPFFGNDRVETEALFYGPSFPSSFPKTALSFPPFTRETLETSFQETRSRFLNDSFRFLFPVL
jgi:hypothetical protein